MKIYDEKYFKELNIHTLLKVDSELKDFTNQVQLNGKFDDEKLKDIMFYLSKLTNTGGVFNTTHEVYSKSFAKLENKQDPKTIKYTINNCTYKDTLVYAVQEIIFLIRLLKIEIEDKKRIEDLLEIVSKEQLQKEE